MRKPILLPVLLACLARQAAAQAAPVGQRVYAQVEQMPQLPGGGGMATIQAVIEQNFRYPAEALRRRVQGRVDLRFTVTATGQTQEVQVVQGLAPDVDSAAMEAVKRLPTFIPGRHHHQAVPVVLSVSLWVRESDVSFDDLVAQQVPASTQPDPVYTYVGQMPQLPGGGSQAAVIAAIRQRLELPADAPEGRVFVKFVVNKAGGVQDVEVVKGLNLAVNEAVLAAVHKLPAFVPGKQNGRLVLVSMLLPITIRLGQLMVPPGKRP